MIATRKDVGEIFLLKAVFENIKGVVPVEHDIKRIFDAGRTGACGIEGQETDLEREIHVSVIPKHPIQQRFPIARLTDDAVGGSFYSPPHPISLRENQTQLICELVLQLPADQGMKIEDQSPHPVQCVFILISDTADLRGKAR